MTALPAASAGCANTPGRTDTPPDRAKRPSPGRTGWAGRFLASADR